MYYSDTNNDRENDKDKGVQQEYILIANIF